METLCIYHNNCSDGFAAAWVVKHFYGEHVYFFPATYGDPPPDVTNKHVILVDFSYPLEIMQGIVDASNSTVVLDHHKTAEAACKNLVLREQDKVVFDMERSGAGLAWRHFFGKQPAPGVLQRIEDRDLWRFSLPHTREVMAAVFSYPYAFDTYTALMRMGIDELVAEGTAIERKFQKDLAEIIPAKRRKLSIANQEVWAINLPYTMASEAGDKLASDSSFSAVYQDDAEYRTFSLRSIEGGEDVSLIAKQYGGGGHKHASGFRVRLSEIQQFEIQKSGNQVEGGA